MPPDTKISAEVMIDLLTHFRDQLDDKLAKLAIIADKATLDSDRESNISEAGGAR